MSNVSFTIKYASQCLYQGRVKSGQRANTGVLKWRKQALIYSQYQQQKAQLLKRMLPSAGKLQVDNDSRCCKMEVFCLDTADALETAERVQFGGSEDCSSMERGVRVSEVGPNGDAEVGPNGDAIFQARRVRKYGGLQWLDPDKTSASGLCILIN